MIVGIGIDIVEMERIQKLMEQQKRFVQRILTENEQRFFDSLSSGRKLEFLAGRFAVKEAYAKAVGTGIGKHVSFQDIEVLPDECGKPVAITALDGHRVHVSISHSRDYAVGQVIIERLSC
jgi:holo-[acyl-carrier protein] synthase